MLITTRRSGVGVNWKAGDIASSIMGSRAVGVSADATSHAPARARPAAPATLSTFETGGQHEAASRPPPALGAPLPPLVAEIPPPPLRGDSMKAIDPTCRAEHVLDLHDQQCRCLTARERAGIALAPMLLERGHVDADAFRLIGEGITTLFDGWRKFSPDAMRAHLTALQQVASLHERRTRRLLQMIEEAV